MYETAASEERREKINNDVAMLSTSTVKELLRKNQKPPYDEGPVPHRSCTNWTDAMSTRAGGAKVNSIVYEAAIAHVDTSARPSEPEMYGIAVMKGSGSKPVTDALADKLASVPFHAH